tara:strand:+ start:126 stop:386 length:261 start_codon:yes stop_codon:yes gene_type:complete
MRFLKNYITKEVQRQLDIYLSDNIIILQNEIKELEKDYNDFCKLIEGVDDFELVSLASYKKMKIIESKRWLKKTLIQEITGEYYDI